MAKSYEKFTAIAGQRFSYRGKQEEMDAMLLRLSTDLGGTAQIFAKKSEGEQATKIAGIVKDLSALFIAFCQIRRKDAGQRASEILRRPFAFDRSVTAMVTEEGIPQIIEAAPDLLGRVSQVMQNVSKAVIGDAGKQGIEDASKDVNAVKDALNDLIKTKKTKD